jgi:membrane-associated phospholipid phosphatase
MRGGSRMAASRRAGAGLAVVPPRRRRRKRRIRPRARSPRVRWPLLLAAAGAIEAARRRNDLGIRPAPATAIVGSAPPVVAAAISPGRVRRAVTWAAQMWAYRLAFEAPHDGRERLRRRMRIDYPIAFDSAIGLGTPPSLRLQRALRRPPRITWLDRALAAVYAVWEVYPHAALALVWWRAPDRFAAAAGRLAATFDLTLLGYWAVPTAPPWWASEKAGRMGGDVHRVVFEVKRDLLGQPRPVADHELGANPWAAMPSDHFATSLTAALLLRELDPRLGLFGLAYAVTLGFALLYLGEHYVADLGAGAALAMAVWVSAPRAAPLAGAVARCWPHP